MKTTSAIFLAAMFFGFVSCNTVMIEDSVIEIPKDITAFQQYVLDEINFARTKPAEYAELRLKDFGERSVDNGSYQYLKTLTPMLAVSFNTSLNLSASNYASFLAEKNLMGHNEDETPLIRAIRAGYRGVYTGENIVAASEDNFNPVVNPQSAAISFVKLLIVDKGVIGTGHRFNILNSNFKTVGIGFGQNPASTYVNYVVQDFGNL